MNEIKKSPDSPVCYIKGVGEKRAKLLEKLGITTALQLAEHYPRGYIDFNETTAVSELMNDGENHVVKAFVTKKFPPYYGRINIFKVLVSDGTGDMLITFFNSDYSFTRLIFSESKRTRLFLLIHQSRSSLCPATALQQEYHRA